MCSSLLRPSMLCVFLLEMTSLPLLQCIFTTPSLNMTPLFNATTVFEYYATVAHDVMLIQVHAPTQHCHVEVRVSNKNGLTGCVPHSRLVNYLIESL